MWDQKLESFLALHERAFRDLGGVPRVVRHDNLKAAVVRACLYDPYVNPVYEAFAKPWGFTPPVRLHDDGARAVRPCETPAHRVG